MSIDLEIHPIQVQILRSLLFQPEARFSELNINRITTDHFSFHLKSLLKAGLVLKNKKNSYSLSPKGKEFANRFDTDNLNLEKQAKVSVIIVGLKIKKGEKQYLIQERLKQPFFGYHGFVGGKIRWGETISETSAREFKEEAGLSGLFSLAGIEHKIDYSKDGKILEDKFFFIVRAVRLKGKLRLSFDGGRNLWFSKKDLTKVPKLFPDVMKIIKVVNQNKVVFFENKFIATDY